MTVIATFSSVWSLFGSVEQAEIAVDYNAINMLIVGDLHESY